MNIKIKSEMTKYIPLNSLETFNQTWPYTAKYSYTNGFAQHYIDEGTGEILLFLHGEPTWGYLFRHQIKTLLKQYRVIALDHMGFGKSETPENRTYFLQDHINNLETFVLDMDLNEITLIMHDFGGPAGMGLAIRHPNRIKRVISINGPTPLGQPDLFERLTDNVSESPWFQWVIKAEKDGSLRRILGDSNFNILSTLKLNGFVDNTIINEDWLNAYRSPFPDIESSFGVIGWAEGFANGMHVFEDVSDSVKIELAQIPSIALWGKEDRTLHGKHFLPLFNSAFPNGNVIEIDNAGHYSPEDQSDLITSEIHKFLNRN